MRIWRIATPIAALALLASVAPIAHSVAARLRRSEFRAWVIWLGASATGIPSSETRLGIRNAYSEASIPKRGAVAVFGDFEYAIDGLDYHLSTEIYWANAASNQPGRD